LRSPNDIASSREDSRPSRRGSGVVRSTQPTRHSELTQSIEDATRYLGVVLANRYRIDRHVASGTMGRVYEGMQIPLERPVAIKILRSTGQFSDLRFKKRFCREASIAAQLQHPNIVSVYDYGEAENGDLFMVMELLSGRSLLAAMLDDGPFSPLRAVNVAMQVTRALRKAHRAGIVHRDLKPANIIVALDEEDIDFVKVLDFGLVKIFAPEEKRVSAPYGEDNLTRAGCMVGTAEYVSPEQALGEEVDGRTDIYSLGVLMFHMIAGKLPFTGSNLLEIINQHFTSEVPRIADIAPEVDCPPDLEGIIRRCMAKLPADRYPSMDVLLADLKLLWRVMTDESCSTEPSIPMLDFELRAALPIGLRRETLSLATNTADFLAPIALTPPPAATGDLTPVREELHGDDPIVDPSEASNHLAGAPIPRRIAPVERPAHRLLLAIALISAALAGAATAYWFFGVKGTLFPATRAAVAPSEAAPSEIEPALVAPPKKEEVQKLLPRSRPPRGYKDNPF
jgi:serine/threonine protein kinase